MFTGRELDAETGLFYYRARYFSADLGRFLARDPLGFSAGDFNLYRYCGNAPIIFIDPRGLDETAIKIDRTRIDTKTLEKLIKEYSDNNRRITLTSTAKRYQGKMNGVLFATFSDLVNGIAAQTESCNKSCGCVSVLEITAHSGPYRMKFGEPDKPFDLDASNVAAFGDELRKNGRLCAKCLIILNGCTTGNARDKSFPQILANRTGCIVVAAGGFVVGDSTLNGSARVVDRIEFEYIDPGFPWNIEVDPDFWTTRYVIVGAGNEPIRRSQRWRHGSGWCIRRPSRRGWRWRPCAAIGRPVNWPVSSGCMRCRSPSGSGG